MIDVITYAKDVTKLMPELVSKMPDYIVYDESIPTKAISINIAKTATVRKGVSTVSLLRLHPKELALFKTLKAIKVLVEVPIYGDYLAAMSVTNRKLYDSVYSQTPTVMLDASGNKLLDALGKPVLFTPDARIGAFS